MCAGDQYFEKQLYDILYSKARIMIGRFLEMEMVEQIKYFGVTVNNNRNYFSLHKKEKILQVKRMVNLTYSIITRSCNKMLIGKTY